MANRKGTGDTSGKTAAKVRKHWEERLVEISVPLRFVYAVRDSVFEEIDVATSTAGARSTRTAGVRSGVMDAAMAGTSPRANRTKFFDIVIPLVPFISHRNARDLLDQLLADRGINEYQSRW